MRTRAMKEHDIGHTLDVGCQNVSSLPFSCLAMDATISGAQGCWKMGGGSVTGKRQTGFILMLVQTLNLISWVIFILSPIGRLIK